MEIDFYKKFSEVEENHWWFRHRKRVIGTVLKRFTPARFDKSLDIGSGTGGGHLILKDFVKEYHGLEFSPEAVKLCLDKYPGLHLVQGDANRLSDYFKDEKFPLITAFNVLYHDMVNDREVIRQASLLSENGGTIVITEAAFKLLKRRHDSAAHGVRRYTVDEIEEILNEFGYKVEYKGYFNLILLPPLLALIAMERIQGMIKKKHGHKETVELNVPPKFINKLAQIVLSFELLLIKFGMQIPLGVNLIVIAKKAQK